MRIQSITTEEILFDNGSRITYENIPDCCEENYADFEQLDDIGRHYDFDENLIFEPVDGSGFMFGDSRRKFFIPCYSLQDGYYSNDVDIYYNDKCVLIAYGMIRGC